MQSEGLTGCNQQFELRRVRQQFSEHLNARLAQELFEIIRQQQRFPLAEARHAQEMLGNGGVTGKIVLVLNGPSLESGAA